MADDYSRILFVRNLHLVDALVAETAAELEADGAAQAAAAVRTAYRQALRQLEELSVRFAQEATAALKRNEVGTRVRPDTGGYHGTRLEDVLRADPLPQLPGSVGLANESVLYEEVPWWWTNEEGYSGLIGNVVHGHFYQPGFVDMSDPGAAQSRTHPLFVAEGGPPMEIQNPIPARRFIERTIRIMEPVWHERVRAIRDEMDGKIGVAVADARAAVLARLRGQIP